MIGDGRAGGLRRRRRVTGSSAGRRVAWPAVLVAAAAVALGGCRLEVDVNVAVEPDGSGVVEVVVALDEEAVRRLGADPAEAILVDDLERTGWEVDGPTAEDDGFTRLRVRRPFADPDGAAHAFADLAAEDGPFRGFALRRDRAFARTTWSFEGTVDLSGGLEAFSDDDLTAALDGEPLGRSVEELEQQLGAALDRLVGLRVSVRLPGDVSSNAATGIANGAVWDVPLGRGPVTLSATGVERNTAALAWVGAGALLALILVVLLLVRLAVRVTDRRGPAVHHEEPEPEPTPPPAPTGPPVAVSSRALAAAGEPEDRGEPPGGDAPAAPELDQVEDGGRPAHGVGAPPAEPGEGAPRA